MRSSLIFKASLKWITPALVLFSLWIFWRGHNLPGGGFIGGLVAACGLSLHLFASPQPNWIQKFRADFFIVAGLLSALGSGLFGLLAGQNYMTAIWRQWGFLPKLGTPILFDFGVYLLVIGVSLLVLRILYSEDQNS
jgi:multisubunit Na+/H+ antiporter MnhB subunit